MKIPTLLGLTFLTLAVTVGIILVIYKSVFLNISKSEVVEPKKIEILNITPHSATVIWLTDKRASGLLSWGDSSSLGNSQNDIRDKEAPVPHLTHIVTIENLNPDTSYFFKVRSGPLFYPASSISFKTAKELSDQKLDELKSVNKPIIGVVVDADLKPVDEALVIFKIDGAQEIATITSTAGNFILPTVNLINSTLSDIFPLTKIGIATLVIERGLLQSEIKISMPPLSSPLPKIVLGQNSDFTSIVEASSSSAKADNSIGKNPYDLNGDGVVNSLDLTILLQSLGKTGKDPKFNKAADLNGDGIVDQKDVDLFKKALH